MRIIQKTISLEPMISRVPSIWPAYKDNKLYFFDDESLKEREYEYPTNYGMIPLSLSVLSASSGYSFSTANDADKMSFERICEYYASFKKYYQLLTCSSHCSRVYSSATDYYSVEIDSKYASQMKYGQDEETYVEIDKAYNKIGGDDFFEWINKNVIPTYKISNEYKGYWQKEYLYYPDVIKWIAWFKEREGYETSETYTAKTRIDIEHWKCDNSGITDCCECEEYFNRGGKRELSAMTEWYNSLQENINAINNIVLDNMDSYAPSFVEQITLKNSLENIGQFSILSPEFEDDIDYRVSKYGESANTYSGTTVIDSSGNTRILAASGKTGFCFSPFYMERMFDDEAWENYTIRYINGNPKEFVSISYKYYAFDDENRVYKGMTNEDVISQMQSGDTYDIITTDSILVDGTLIPIEKSEYGIYDPSNSILGGRTYFVYREKDTSTPYTIINGKKIYADSYLSPTRGMCYYFSFFPKNRVIPAADGCHNNSNTFNIDNYKIFGRKKTTNSAELITYISLNDKTYIVGSSASYITINDITYPRVNGYVYDKYGNIIYVSNNELYDSEFFKLSSAYTLGNEAKTIYVNVYNDDIIIYSTNEITGITISKLSDLESTNKLCDDTGNDIDGIYNDTCRKINGQSSAMTYAQPPMYTVLEPLYQVGNTSLIGKFKLTQEDETKIEDNTNYFIGNIIDSMTFYYKDVNGNKVEETSVRCNSNVTSLSAITSATTAKDNIDSSNPNIVFDESLYCDIEYYIGATLKRVAGQPFSLANKDKYNYGVKYNETVKFNKKEVFFRLKVEPNEEEIIPTQKYETQNLPHKYIIYTYEIEQELIDVENNMYDSLYQVPLAKFTTEINLIDENSKPNFSKYMDMDEYNGIKVSPVFKEEYKMGLSMMEKVDSDIYIDRGINAAFEKHLKLQEVNSLEALEQFGNGYFKIMNS